MLLQTISQELQPAMFWWENTLADSWEERALSVRKVGPCSFGKPAGLFIPLLNISKPMDSEGEVN
jgi:hypothetical protein